MLKENFAIDDLPNDVLRGIYQYWMDKRGERRMPSCEDINKVDIPQLWSHINFIEVDREQGRYRCRRAGSETVRAMDIDFTGKYLDELPYIELMLKDKYDRLVEKKKPYFNFDKLKWSNKSYLNYYALGLPLSDEDREVNMVMLGLYYLSPGQSGESNYGSGI